MGDAVRIFATGGTLDKVYNPITERLEFTKTHVDEILETGRVRGKYTIETLMLKDSLYMTPEDRLFILRKCISCDEKRILIAHGTGTMVETGEILGKGSECLEDKTIVLVGAMIPYTVGRSDAVFSVAGGYYAALTLPAGVYITMNGQIFNWDNVRKNTEKGYFEKRRL